MVQTSRCIVPASLQGSGPCSGLALMCWWPCWGWTPTCGLGSSWSWSCWSPDLQSEPQPRQGVPWYLVLASNCWPTLGLGRQSQRKLPHSHLSQSASESENDRGTSWNILHQEAGNVPDILLYHFKNLTNFSLLILPFPFPCKCNISTLEAEGRYYWFIINNFPVLVLCIGRKS